VVKGVRKKKTEKEAEAEAEGFNIVKVLGCGLKL
jgi:hypothetical protein